MLKPVPGTTSAALLCTDALPLYLQKIIFFNIPTFGSHLQGSNLVSTWNKIWWKKEDRRDINLVLKKHQQLQRSPEGHLFKVVSSSCTSPTT